MIRSGQAWVEVDHHQFYLLDRGVPITATKTARPLINRLIGVCPGAAWVRTGIRLGSVWVHVEEHDAAPTPQLERWDDVIELSYHATHGGTAVTGWAGVEPAEPLVVAHDPGHYRLRIHARQRDKNYDLAVVNAQEEYLILTWPAHPTSVQTLKTLQPPSALQQSDGVPLQPDTNERRPHT